LTRRLLSGRRKCATCRTLSKSVRVCIATVKRGRERLRSPTLGETTLPTPGGALMGNKRHPGPRQSQVGVAFLCSTTKCREHRMWDTTLDTTSDREWMCTDSLRVSSRERDAQSNKSLRGFAPHFRAVWWFIFAPHFRAVWWFTFDAGSAQPGSPSSAQPVPPA